MPCVFGPDESIQRLRFSCGPPSWAPPIIRNNRRPRSNFWRAELARGPESNTKTYRQGRQARTVQSMRNHGTRQPRHFGEKSQRVQSGVRRGLQCTHDCYVQFACQAPETLDKLQNKSLAAMPGRRTR